MKYTACIFDLDNTVLLKSPSITGEIGRILSDAGHGFSLPSLELAYAESERWQGLQIEKENLTGVLMPDQEFFQNVLAVYHKHLSFDSRLDSDILQVLTGKYSFDFVLEQSALSVFEALSSKNIPLGIVSNNYASIRKTLDVLGIAKFFHPILLSQECGLSKPDPRILLLAAEEMGVRAQDCLYVGDHPLDIRCAHAAGMGIAWKPVNSFFRLPDAEQEPEYRIGGLDDLLSILL